MLDVLLESRAARSRFVGSTLASAALHGVLISAAVALTVKGRAGGTPPLAPPVLTYVLPLTAPSAAPLRHFRVEPSGRALPGLRTISVPVVAPAALPALDVGPVLLPDEIRVGGPARPFGAPAGAPGAESAGGGSPVDAAATDRAPRIVGRTIEPRYPPALRDAGVEGRVVAQFIVDTLGRAEMDDLLLVQASHALFAESVRKALEQFRFSPGELGGRKVRTKVQIPFEFTLRR